MEKAEQKLAVEMILAVTGWQRANKELFERLAKAEEKADYAWANLNTAAQFEAQAVVKKIKDQIVREMPKLRAQGMIRHLVFNNTPVAYEVLNPLVSEGTTKHETHIKQLQTRIAELEKQLAKQNEEAA